MSWLNYEFEDVRKLVIKGHKGQKYGEYDYYWHLVSVADKVRFLYGNDKDLSKLVELAWCHDLLEDNPDFYNENVKPLLPKSMHESVEAISKRIEETRSEYLDRCVKNEYARKVKIADTMSNLEMSVKSNDIRRVRKYSKQIKEIM